MSNFTLFSTAFLVALSGALMPGPLLTVTINQSLQRGLVVGPLIVLGHGFLEILVVVALLAGLGSVLAHPGVGVGVALGGGLVLAWMGYGMVREAVTGRLTLDLEVQEGREGGRGVFISGVVATGANPYWLLWWATIGTHFVSQAWQNGTMGMVAFFSGHILADFLWYSFITFVVVSGKRFITDGIYRGLVVVLGSFLIGLAGYFVVSFGAKVINL